MRLFTSLNDKWALMPSPLVLYLLGLDSDAVKPGVTYKNCMWESRREAGPGALGAAHVVGGQWRHGPRCPDGHLNAAAHPHPASRVKVR